MKTRFLSFYLAVFSLFMIFLFVSYTSGPPQGYTGSPGDGRNCSACHSPTNNYNPQITVQTNIPSSGYTPGSTYQITLSVSSNSSKHGFQMTAEDVSNTRRGTFQNTDTNTQTAGNNQYIEHTSSGTSQTSWTFNWIAPQTGAGTITFYGTLNATNANNSTTGDSPVAFSYAFQENTTSVSENSIPGISITPNPVMDYLIIENVSNETIKSLSIYDLSGKLIAKFNDFSTRLDLRNLSTGRYLLKISTENKTGTYHLLKR